jgi:hypothetical protein
MKRIIVRKNILTNVKIWAILWCSFIVSTASGTRIGVVNPNPGVEQPPYFYADLDTAGYSEGYFGGGLPYINMIITKFCPASGVRQFTTMELKRMTRPCG